jgi:peptidoglycan L-alanyl-D-glutamate endopeptidase CwlK
MKPEALPVEKRHSRTDLLAPFFEKKILTALAECQDQGYPLIIFETYRSPARQEFLYEQGRTRPGKIVTKAKPWQSWHGFALAADVVFYDNKRFSWEGPWDKVHNIFEQHGLETLSWEKPHVQITGGLTTQEAYKIYLSQGMIGVWDVIQRRLDG